MKKSGGRTSIVSLSLFFVLLFVFYFDEVVLDENEIKETSSICFEPFHFLSLIAHPLVEKDILTLSVSLILIMFASSESEKLFVSSFHYLNFLIFITICSSFFVSLFLLICSLFLPPSHFILSHSYLSHWCLCAANLVPLKRIRSLSPSPSSPSSPLPSPFSLSSLSSYFSLSLPYFPLLFLFFVFILSLFVPSYFSVFPTSFAGVLFGWIYFHFLVLDSQSEILPFYSSSSRLSSASFSSPPPPPPSSSSSPSLPSPSFHLPPPSPVSSPTSPSPSPSPSPSLSLTTSTRVGDKDREEGEKRRALARKIVEERLAKRNL